MRGIPYKNMVAADFYDLKCAALAKSYCSLHICEL